MNNTKINWTDVTWNYPVGGCKKLSTECAHCYAFTLAEDKRGTAAFPFGFDLTMRRHKEREPAKLLRSVGPSLVFCNSMTDPGLQDSELSNEEFARLRSAGLCMDDVRDLFFDAIEGTPEHRYQVLTKRPEVILNWLFKRGRTLPRSVWMGCTIGHESTLGRLHHLHRFRDFGAKVLFISAEPLLSDLVAAGMRLSGIDWIITGGESGRHASNLKTLERRFLVEQTRGERPGVRAWTPREDRVEWVRKIRDEAVREGCAFWHKQWGGPRPESGGRLLDGVEHNGMPTHVAGAMPERRGDLGGAATTAMQRKAQRHLPIVTAAV